MHPRFLKQIFAALCIILILSGIVCGCVRLSELKKARAELDKMNHQFLSAVLTLGSRSDEIEFADLIPAEWDKMYVFGSYATQEEKFEAAGCVYNLAISDGVSESLISLLFTSGDEVAYYVEFYSWQLLPIYSAQLIIDKEFDYAVFEYADRPRLVRSFDYSSVNRQTADEIVRFILTADGAAHLH